jgi:hypothetical protein
MEHRFKKYVSSTHTETGCLLWTGYKQQVTSSYTRGFFSVNGKPEMAHRVAYRLSKGEIPEGMCVRHTCDVSLCVNPDHLIIGTQADNMNDMKERGRRKNITAVRGEKQGTSKLTEDLVREILASKESRNQIATRLNVSPSTIKAIRTRRLWKHISSVEQ